MSMNNLVYHPPNRYFLNGQLHETCRGGPGMVMEDHIVYVVKVLPDNVPFPILVGDRCTTQLGWVNHLSLSDRPLVTL